MPGTKRRRIESLTVEEEYELYLNEVYKKYENQEFHDLTFPLVNLKKGYPLLSSLSGEFWTKQCTEAIKTKDKIGFIASLQVDKREQVLIKGNVALPGYLDGILKSLIMKAEWELLSYMIDYYLLDLIYDLKRERHVPYLFPSFEFMITRYFNYRSFCDYVKTQIFGTDLVEMGSQDANALQGYIKWIKNGPAIWKTTILPFIKITKVHPDDGQQTNFWREWLKDYENSVYRKEGLEGKLYFLKFVLGFDKLEIKDLKE